MPQNAKVAAHQNISDDMDQLAKARAVGNDHADQAAKKGARQHPAPSKHEVTMAKHQWDFAQFVYTAMAEVLPHWPQMAKRRPERLSRRQVAPPGGGPAEGSADAMGPTTPHTFEKIAGRVVCVQCSLIKRTWRAAHKDKTECHGPCPLLKQVFDTAHDLGHEITVFAWKGLAGAVCTKCGAHTCSGRLDHLRWSCLKKPPSAAGVATLARVAKGFHPHHRHRHEVLDECWPLQATGL